MQSGLWKKLGVSSRDLLCVTASIALSIAAPALAAQDIATTTSLQLATTHQGSALHSSITVHVQSSEGSSQPSGVITLVDGAYQLGSAILDDTGTATMDVPALTPGTHSLHALYNGSAALAPSLSSASEITAEAAGVPDFTVSANPSAISVVQGSAVTTILSLTPVSGFSQYVTLSCSSLPPLATCNFVPANVSVSGAKASVSTLSVSTLGPTGPKASLSPSDTGNRTLVYAFLVPGLLGLAGLGLRGHRLSNTTGLLLLILSIGGGLTGCSQRYDYLKRQPAASPGTPLGTTQFILEAQSISGSTVVTHTINIALTVTAAP